MSQNPSFPLVPSSDSEDDPDVETKEVDGEPVIDPDANDDLIDSAAADRLAAQNGDDPDEP
ncbi:MAG: hypothetical protein JSS74_12375 [Actinobacteria bacterium]|nr:hypothetical protein [Actinomycetota bacterium]